MMFRFLLTWLGYHHRGPLEVLDTGVLIMRVWPTDLDLNMHMNNGRYFTAADVGRFDWWLRTGVWDKVRTRGWGPVAGDANGRFSRSLQPFEKFELHTRLLGWDEKWLFTEHRFVSGSGSGTVAAVIVVRYLFRGREARQSPAAVLSLVGHTKPSPPLPDWVRDWHSAQNELTATLKNERIR